MKKLIALLLATMLLFLGAMALAEGGTTYDANDQNTWRTEPTSFTFAKNYVKDSTVTTKEAAAVFPAEPLTFTVAKAAGSTNPDDTMITVGKANEANASNTYTIQAVDGEIPVYVPSYSKAGKYEYTITEVPGSAQGVSRYDSTSINVAVLVSFDYDHSRLAVQAGVEGANADAVKMDKLYNQYDVGGLEVSKAVEGNLGDRTVAFDIDVTFKTEAGKTVYSDITYSGGTDEVTQTIAKDWTGEKTVTVHLKHGDSVAFTNIPAGVTYTVVEQAKHAETRLNDPAKGYTAAYKNTDNQDTTSGSGKIGKDDADTVAITNTKSTGINTGITLDSLPYIIALAVVAVGVALFLARRRHREDD